MGYRTYHTMMVLDTDEEKEGEIIDKLRETCEDAKYSIDEDGYPMDETKWYDCDQHLREFSKKYPDVVICIHGEGEETGDIWDHYFKDGKMQSCDAEVIIPPYDESKLE